MQDFITELSNYLADNLSSQNEDVPIIEDIVSKNSLTTGNENAIRWSENDVILKYSRQNFSNNTMYFVKDNKRTYWKNNEKYYDNNVYTVLKVENDKIEEIGINKKDIPKKIGVNDVFKIEKNKYIINESATKELQTEIMNMAKKIINKQNFALNKHRKEGHMYVVTGEIGDNRFLWDITQTPKIEFEEVNIPKDLLSKATEGAVLKYTNGKYEYQADNVLE